MPRKGGNRAAQEAGSMRSAKQEGGSTGGRCAAASSSKGPRKQPVGRPKNKPSAEPHLRPRSSRRRMPARQPACSGDPLSCPLSFVLSSLTVLPSLCSKQSRERKQLFVAALFASFVCCSCVYQNLAFINAVYLKKRNREGRRTSCRRSTKKARQQQHRQHLR